MKGKITFVPSFLMDPNSFNEFMDGDFNWNGAWPVELTTASQGSSDTSLSSALTDFTWVIWVYLCPGRDEYYSPFIYLPRRVPRRVFRRYQLSQFQRPFQTNHRCEPTNTSENNSFNHILSSQQIHQIHGWGFASCQGVGFVGFPISKRWLAFSSSESDILAFALNRCPSLLLNHYPNTNHTSSSTQQTNTSTPNVGRLSSILVSRTMQRRLSPSNPLNIDIIQIISWNDYGESHYIGPIKGAQPTGSEAWTGGMGHAAWLPLTSYYASAFKNGGQYPDISKEDEKLVMWSRIHSAQAQVGDPVGEVTGKELVEDTVWAITLLAEPANVTFEVYAYTPSSSSSSSSNTTTTTDADVDNNIISSQTFSVPAGLSKLAMPIGFPDAGGDGGIQSLSVRARVVRSGSASTLAIPTSQTQATQIPTRMQETETTGQGENAQTLAPFVFVKNPEKYNYNAWVECVSSSGVAC
ncbi:hypothetical protein D9758_002517 [Tetrapyrgos nigripes]|uniref:Uncharacterized protein n=1 Tax=Tetrapyrgos nigripes TaxID=182062 RepID=A0A8H5GR25_9AGAR|nr:hypothetical protein D9758_002517 [Tetrapyrgos nigripes]